MITPERRTWICWIAALTCLSAVTAWFFLLVPLHRSVGPDLLANAAFAEGFDGWRIEGPSSQVLSAPGLVGLHNDDRRTQVGLKQLVAVPDEFGYLRLSAEVAAVDIRPGAKVWHAARVYAAPNSAEGEPIWSRLSTLVALDDAADWRSYDAVLRLPEGTRSVIVGLQMAWTEGRMQVRNLSLVPVEPRGFVRPVKIVLGSAWATVLIAFGVALWRALPTRRVRVLLPTVIGTLMGGVLMPAPVKNGILGSIFGAPDGVAGAVPDGPFGLFAAVQPEALGHFVMFALLAAVTERSRVGRPAVWLAGLLIFAAVTEMLQFFAFDRTPNVGDWLVDAAGIVTGWLIAGAVVSGCSRIRRPDRAVGTTRF